MQKICLIVPCYNEENRLRLDVLEAYSAHRPNVNFVFVNDGSNDNTLQKLQYFCSSHPAFSVIDQQPNKGKAEAVRTGMLQCATQFNDVDYFGYWDADLSTPLEELDWFLHISNGAFTHRFIIGSRVSRLGAQVQRKMIRHYLGRVFSTVASNILKLSVYDTQCGAKLLHKSLVGIAFDQPFTSKWLFDVEIFARLTKALKPGQVVKEVLEVPLRTWTDVKGSKLQLSSMIKVPFDLVRIWWTYRH